MAKFFNKFRQPCFWSIFGPFSQFWGKIFFFVSSAMPKLEKTNDTIPRKPPDRRTKGRTDSISLDPSGHRRESNKVTEIR